MDCNKAGTFEDLAWHCWLLINRWLLLGICLLILGGCQLQGRPDDAGVVRLTLWHGVNPPSNRDVLQELMDRFNRKHPDIQVDSLYVGQQDQQMPKILASVVGNALPDMLLSLPERGYKMNRFITGKEVTLGFLKV